MKKIINTLMIFAVMMISCQKVGQNEDGQSGSVEPPVADLLDVFFKADGTAEDKSQSKMPIFKVKGSESVNYFHDFYQRYVSHFSHELAGTLSQGYFKINYASNTSFRNSLSNGYALEIVFRMDMAPNGKEIKPFSSMQSGGTGIMITDASRGKNITFLSNISSDGSSSWKWAQSGVVPEVGRYYHVIGVWDKEAGLASIYVDGEKKGETPAKGKLNFPTGNNTWFCIGGDPLNSEAEAGFNGDVVIARIYDTPLTAGQVSALYSQVKNDSKEECLDLSDLSFLAEANVSKGCWYYLYSKAFKNGDVISLESIETEDKVFECETVYEDGLLKIRIPDDFTAGQYRISLSRATNKYLITYAKFNFVDEIAQVNTRVIAHRGYHPGNIPENSMASLIEAQKHDVYGSEFDVYVTTDDVVVLYHNPSLSGTEHPDNAALKGKRVDNYTYDEIKDYKLANGEPLPTLDDYLEQALKNPKVKLILEIKTHDSAEKNMRAAKACYEAVKEKNMQDQVEYIAFSYDVCKELVRLDPDAIVQYLSGDKTPAQVYEDGIRGIDYNSSLLVDSWIKSAHELGMTVNVWTVNSKSEMVEFMTKGVDFITTDEVEVALSVTGKPFVANE